MHCVQFSTIKIGKRHIHIYKYSEIGTIKVKFKHYWEEEKDAPEKDIRGF